MLCLLEISAACSDGGGAAAHPCQDEACVVDASSATGTPSAQLPIKDAGWRTGAIALPDSSLDGWVPDRDLPLQARIQVTGQNLPCGACAVLVGQAQGGLRPYTYVWSDPTLDGPGPHKVCPTAAVSYSLTVTDSTPTVSGEFSTTQMTAADQVMLDCVADAGTADWAGCDNPGVPDDVPVQCEGSSAQDAGVLTDNGYSNTWSASSLLATPLVAGKAYQFTYDNILPFYIGDGISVDVYGAMKDAPCEPKQKLFTLAHDAVWTQSYCFTPDQSYERTLAHIAVKNIWFDFQLGTIPTLCKGCALTPP